MKKRAIIVYMQGKLIAEQLRRLGVSTSKFAKLVGISQPAMRLLLAGANSPKPEHAKRIDAVLADLSRNACPTCGRAFIEQLSEHVSKKNNKKSKKQHPAR